MTGDISRADWVVPVQALTHAHAEGIVRLVACRDGSVLLHLRCAGTQGAVRLDVSRAAQLSTGIWEAAGVSQRLTSDLDDGQPTRPRLPQLPARSRKPARSLVTVPPSRSTALRRPPAGIGGGSAVEDEGAAMDAKQARTIGARLHRLRQARASPSA